MTIAYSQLNEAKNKYAKEILTLDGVHAVGIRVLEQKIIVYAHDLSPVILTALPFELEGYAIEIRGQKEPKPTALSNFADPTQKDTITDKNGFWYHSTRPSPPGISINHYGTPSTGTLGSYWWSEKHQCHVIISNNHILGRSSGIGFTNARKRQKTNTLPFTVLPGGVEYTGLQLNDLNMDFTDFIFERNSPVLTNLSASDGTVGQVITIYGKNLGFRKGYGKVFFGNKEAIVKSWGHEYVGGFDTHTRGFAIGNLTFNYSKDTNSFIEVYVPSGLTGQVEIFIECEGDPIVQAGPYDQVESELSTIDYKQILTKQIAELIDYHPFDLTRYDNSDLGVARPVVPLEELYPSIIRHLPHPNANSAIPVVRQSLSLRTYSKAGQEYTPQGVQMALCEGMPVIKTGRSTGTTISAIGDASYTLEIQYNSGLGMFGEAKNVMLDTVGIRSTYSNTQELDTNLSLPFIVGGDSGSSLFTTTYQDYLDYMNEFNAWHPSTGTESVSWWDYPRSGEYRVTPEQYAQVEQTIGAITPFMLIGNCFASIFYDPMEVIGIQDWADKASNWATPMGLVAVEPPPPDTSIRLATTVSGVSLMEVVLSIVDTSVKLNATIMGTSTIQSEISIINTYQEVSVIFGIASNIQADLTLIAVPSSSKMVSFELSNIQPTLFNEVDFSLSPLNGDIEISCTIVSQSKIQIASEIIPATIYEIVLGIIQGQSVVNINYSLVDADILEVSTLFQVSSYLESTVVVIGEIEDLLASAVFIGSTALQSTARLFIPGTENTQYEHIYFEITRSQDINTEITRSIDLNLAV